MPDTPVARRGAWIAYGIVVLLTASATFAVMLLWQNIAERKQEARQHVFRVVELTEASVDPADWGRNYPRQYDGYTRTQDNERPRWSVSEGDQKLDIFPSLRTLYDGYPFSRDFRTARGHAYMLSDQDQSPRVKEFKQFGACLHCHASVTTAYRDAGRAAGVPDDQSEAQMMKGFEAICPLPLDQARKRVAHPVTCLDCHDPATLQLRVTRPGFLNGIRAFAKSATPAPHLPSVEAWRKGKKDQDYDPNHDASRQELRSLVCGQCHVEYYFKGKEKLVTYPWHNGLRVEHAEAYYDEQDFSDWTHPRTGAKLLKAQHPEFEMWSQGIHARSGVACADCHMPYRREGAIKISDHQVRSPMLNVAAACQTCHRHAEDELFTRVELIQERNKALIHRGETALLELIEAVQAAKKAGVADERLRTAQALHRKAQFRLDFVLSENSMGFHAPQEASRVLAEAIDYARRAQIEVLKLGGLKAAVVPVSP